LCGFQLKNAPKVFGVCSGADSAPLDLLAGFKSGGRREGRTKGKIQEGIDS